MELTMIQKDLLSGLKAFGVEDDTTKVIFLFLKDSNRNMLELMDYMYRNQSATEQQILWKLEEILKSGNG